MINDYYDLKKKMVGSTESLYDMMIGRQPSSNTSDTVSPAVSDQSDFDDIEPDDDAPVSSDDEPPEETEPSVQVSNSYYNADADDDLSTFEKQIGKSMIPGAIIVPPDADPEPEPDSDPPVKQTPLQGEVQPVVARVSKPINLGKDDDLAPSPIESSPDRQRKPYVAPKSDAVVKINYTDEKDKGIRFSNLKTVPADLVEVVARYFPTASNKMDAVAAYLYIKEGKPSDVNIPDGIKEIAESYQGDAKDVGDVESAVNNSINELRRYVQKQLREISERLYTVEIITGFTLFDQLNFRQKSAATPNDVDLGETMFADLLKHIDKEANLMRKKEEYDKNRPF